MPTKGPPSWFDSIHVSLAGSYIAMEGAFRQRNEVSSGASDPGFGTIPLQNSPLYSENELRFSAQQSRIALKASGDIDPTRHVKGYYEMDFLGAATTANMRESNSYTPRIARPTSPTMMTTSMAISAPAKCGAWSSKTASAS